MAGDKRRARRGAVVVETGCTVPEAGGSTPPGTPEREAVRERLTDVQLANLKVARDFIASQGGRSWRHHVIAAIDAAIELSAPEPERDAAALLSGPRTGGEIPVSDEVYRRTAAEVLANPPKFPKLKLSVPRLPRGEALPSVAPEALRKDRDEQEAYPPLESGRVERVSGSVREALPVRPVAVSVAPEALKALVEKWREAMGMLE